jgi:hypothetical protein
MALRLKVDALASSDRRFEAIRDIRLYATIGFQGFGNVMNMQLQARKTVHGTAPLNNRILTRLIGRGIYRRKEETGQGGKHETDNPRSVFTRDFSSRV